VLVAIFIKIVSPGPIFFKQERIGYEGKPFTFIKFRTMKHNAATGKHQQHLKNLILSDCDDNDCGAMVKLENDPQIIPFGKILRKTCIDEIPQLINVLRGEMSLVGPRPSIPYEVEHYLRWHDGRFDAVPGMTGLWQVSGKNRLTFKEMVRLDIRYTRQMSFWMDMKIICKTPFAIAGQVLDGLKEINLSTEGIEENA
jgi:lipopolysaccharide/colanic/teichoic acid biosynthesis glycosyltransferase